MGWDDNPYSSPERFGLKQIVELDFSSGWYEFDYTVVWTREGEQQFYWADDAGCSCPSPFEGFDSIEGLEHGGLEPLEAHLKQRFDGQYDLHVKLAVLEQKLSELRAIASGWPA